MSRAVDPGPCRASVDVTPHDTNAQSVGRGTFVGVAGDIVGRLVDSAADQTFTLAAGVWPLVFQYIRATGTTATQIKVLF